MNLQENGESYYLMKGRQYMDRIISLLRCYYKSLEIALEDRPDLPIITKSGTVSTTGGERDDNKRICQWAGSLLTGRAPQGIHTAERHGHRRKRGHVRAIS